MKSHLSSDNYQESRISIYIHIKSDLMNKNGRINFKKKCKKYDNNVEVRLSSNQILKTIFPMPTLKLCISTFTDKE